MKNLILFLNELEDPRDKRGLKHELTIIRENVGKEHIHILISCPPTISPAEIAKKLK